MMTDAESATLKEVNEFTGPVQAPFCWRSVSVGHVMAIAGSSAWPASHNSSTPFDHGDGTAAFSGSEVSERGVAASGTCNNGCRKGENSGDVCGSARATNFRANARCCGNRQISGSACLQGIIRPVVIFTVINCLERWQSRGAAVSACPRHDAAFAADCPGQRAISR